MGLGLQSVLENRLAVCLPAVAGALASIIIGSGNDGLQHRACCLLGCGLHTLEQVRHLFAERAL